LDVPQDHRTAERLADASGERRQDRHDHDAASCSLQGPSCLKILWNEYTVANEDDQIRQID
jgi:hypothetical protein